jgi:peptidoglycan/xylan/chitin deacetylase (PgdA/CDA1 family)
LVSGNVSNKSVIVTFDDGYADNLWNAKPLLEHYNIPATVFVTSGYVDSKREFPSDWLERCLLRPETLPDSLTLIIGGKTYSWKIDNSKTNFDEWNVTMKTDPTSRHRCYRELHRLIRPLDYDSRQAVLEALTNWASCPTHARPEYRVLNTNELKVLSEDGLVEIGSHGVNHLVQAEQPAEIQWKDISEGKQHLENILGKPVTSFAYPYGNSNDVSEQTINIVKETGIQIACANVAAPITVGSDLFWLPRFLVRDWDGQELTKQLRKALNG